MEIAKGAKALVDPKLFPADDGDALQNAATTSAVRLWKWNRARKKKSEQQEPR